MSRILANYFSKEKLKHHYKSARKIKIAKDKGDFHMEKKISATKKNTCLLKDEMIWKEKTQIYLLKSVAVNMKHFCLHLTKKCLTSNELIKVLLKLFDLMSCG